MVCPKDPENININMDDDALKQVPEFRYLGSIFTEDGKIKKTIQRINPLTPNDLYMSRTAPLTSKRCILHIYSTNIGIEYFKHALYSPFFLFKMQLFS